MKVPFLVFLFSRAAILFVTYWSLTLDPRVHNVDRLLEFPAVQGLCRWDCGFFLEIATHGYTAPCLSNFFPLFPLLGRVVYKLTSFQMDICLVLVANVFGFVGLASVYKVFADIEGAEIATTGIALLAAWPFSFFQASAYPESMMLASSALAILFAMRSQWIRAGMALGLGLLSRHLVIFTVGALLVAQVRAYRGSRGKRVFAHSFAGLLVALATAGLYPLYLYRKFHDPLLWLRSSMNWGGPSPWMGLYRFFEREWWTSAYFMYVLLWIIPTAGTLWLLKERRHRVLAGFALPLLVCLSMVGLAALGRYSQSLWPAFLPIAIEVSRHPEWKSPTLVAFALVQGMYLYFFAHLWPIL